MAIWLRNMVDCGSWFERRSGYDSSFAGIYMRIDCGADLGHPRLRPHQGPSCSHRRFQADPHDVAARGAGAEPAGSTKGARSSVRRALA
jgi:hypothetical protein